MKDSLTTALSNERILLDNALATVTEACVVFRNATDNSRSILSLSRVKSVTAVRWTRPGLLVLAAAAFLIAAAAHFSKEGGFADIPIALVGLMLVAGYVGTRRAAVSFDSVDGMVQTLFGSLPDASAIVIAVRSAMAGMEDETGSESLAS